MREFVAAAVQVAPSSAPLTADTIAGNTEHARRSRPPLRRRDRGRVGGPAGIGDDRLHAGSAGRGTLATGERAARSDHRAVPAAECTNWASTWWSEPMSAGRNRIWSTTPRSCWARPGDLLGTYRKTHPFGTERADRGGWVTPGEDTLVVDTDLGRIGVIICFDGDYPELSRITAIQGAEIICRPSALLRSADLWELTNRARVLRQSRLPDRLQRHRRRPGRRHLLRQLDDRHARSPR